MFFCFLLYTSGRTEHTHTWRYTLRIGLDFAGVVADVHEARRQLLTEMYGHIREEDGTLVPFDRSKGHAVKNVSVGRCPIFTFTKHWVQEAHEDDELLSVTPEMYDRMKVELYGSKTRVENIPQVPGALKGIEALLKAGHEVELVTSRSHLPLQGVYWWISGNGLSIPIRHSIKKKLSILSEYDLFVDDKISQLGPCEDLDTIRLLFMHHYNCNDISVMNAARNCGWIADWGGILRVVEGRSK